MKPEIKKTLTGKYVVKYDCPHCGDRLESPFDDVGGQDTCPNCGKKYEVPGQAEKVRVAKERQAAARKKQQEQGHKAEEAWLAKEVAGRVAKEATAAAVHQAKTDLMEELQGNKYPFKQETYNSVIGIGTLIIMAFAAVFFVFFIFVVFVTAESIMHEIFGMIAVLNLVIICGVSVLAGVGWKIVKAQIAMAKETSRTRAMIQFYLAYQQENDYADVWK
jgi:predicted RNA-binding Zn-ribbon protein involved in translation (DUF1610 family)